jgi:hypothetical protein
MGNGQFDPIISGTSTVGTGAAVMAGGKALISASTGNVVGAALELFGDIINAGVSGWAMHKQEEQSQQANAVQGLQYQQEKQLEQERYDIASGISKEQRDYQRYQDRQTALKSFGNDLQNYLNSDRNAGAFVANLWRKAA